MSEFDAFARNYQELVSQNVRMTGEPADYFARYKVAYIARRAGPVKKLLDYGCGIGLLSCHLKLQFPTVQIDGFDPSEESLQQVADSLRKQGILTTDPKELARDYDTIVIANVLHHVLPGERQSLLRDITERLNPGGKLVIFEHNPINPLTRWAVSRCPLDDDAVLLPIGETKAYLRKCELRLLRRDYVVFFPRLFRCLRPLEVHLGWVPLGAQYALVASKATPHRILERS